MARLPRFLLSPRWIALLVFALLVVAVCVRLGIWQLDRLDQRRALNASVERGLAAPPVPIEDLLPPDRPAEDPEDLAYRRITATGTFDAEHEVLLFGRALDGRPGHHVLTPLVLPDGRALVVDRGWVPYELDTPPVAQAPPPPGEVSVTGFLLPAAEDGGVGERAPDGRLLTVTGLDPEAIGEALAVPTLPLAAQLQDLQPPSGRELPTIVPPPELSEGPHLSYAIQWFTFATIAIGGYLVLVRREVRERRRLPAGEAPG
jgi:cytochrome oxidase assembly protein ShyY1